MKKKYATPILGTSELMAKTSVLAGSEDPWEPVIPAKGKNDSFQWTDGKEQGEKKTGYTKFEW